MSVVIKKALRPAGYFKIKENQKLFINELGKKLGFNNPSDWYKITTKDIRSNGGTSLLKQFKLCPLAVVTGVMNEETWLPWLFRATPRLGWTESQTERSRYMEYLFEQLHFNKTEDWYGICSADLIDNHGSALLQKYGNSPSKLVMGILVDHPWQVWKFTYPPRNIWDDKTTVEKYVKYLGEELGYTTPEDWYQLSVAQLQNNYGGRLLRAHAQSPALFVMRTMPHHAWAPWRFSRASSPAVLRGNELVRCVNHMETSLNIREHADWYRVDRAKLASCAQGFAGISEFLSNTLQTVYPDHVWEAAKFTQYSKGSVQRWLKVLLEKEFAGREVIENYVHPSQFFPSVKPMSVDVFIPSLKLAFDYNGEQHYKQYPTSRSLHKRQRLDYLKERAFIDAGYTFVVVPSWWDGTLASLLPNIQAFKNN